MKLYHRTYHANAVLVSGFRDWTGTYMTRHEHTGVWFADRPLDENEGAAGDIVLVVEMPDVVAESYEWVQDIGYREFLIPADVANQYGRPEVAVDERDWPEHQARRRGHGLPIDVAAAYLLHAENGLQESDEPNPP